MLRAIVSTGIPRTNSPEVSIMRIPTNVFAFIVVSFPFLSALPAQEAEPAEKKQPTELSEKDQAAAPD